MIEQWRFTAIISTSSARVPAQFFGLRDPDFGSQAQDPLLEIETAKGVDLHNDEAVVECFNNLFLT